MMKMKMGSALPTRPNSETNNFEIAERKLFSLDQRPFSGGNGRRMEKETLRGTHERDFYGERFFDSYMELDLRNGSYLIRRGCDVRGKRAHTSEAQDPQSEGEEKKEAGGRGKFLLSKNLLH
jgi:hypothetical protein